MFTKQHNKNGINAVCVAILSLGILPAGSGNATADGPHRHYFAEARLFSLKPDAGLDTYRNRGKGGVGPGGELGLGVSSGNRDFDVTIRGEKKRGRFVVRVAVEPGENDSQTKPLNETLDLSDLKPHMFEIARDDDGRVYRLSLFPQVITSPMPKTFHATDLKLDHWCFRDSHIIMNDLEYLGRINVCSGRIAWIDIPGEAKLEFSLLPLTDGIAGGVLNDGTLNIAHDNKTRIRITNVLNGVEQSVLQGGPYRVWVRWLKPSQTVEEYEASLKKRLVTLKGLVTSGDIELPELTIELLERASKSGRIQVSYGVRAPLPDEILPESEL